MNIWMNMNEYLRYMCEMDIYKISNAISFWACFIEIQIKSHILIWYLFGFGAYCSSRIAKFLEDILKMYIETNLEIINFMIWYVA